MDYMEYPYTALSMHMERKGKREIVYQDRCNFWIFTCDLEMLSKQK